MDCFGDFAPRNDNPPPNLLRKGGGFLKRFYGFRARIPLQKRQNKGENSGFFKTKIQKQSLKFKPKFTKKLNSKTQIQKAKPAKQNSKSHKSSFIFSVNSTFPVLIRKSFAICSTLFP